MSVISKVIFKIEEFQDLGVPLFWQLAGFAQNEGREYITKQDDLSTDALEKN